MKNKIASLYIFLSSIMISISAILVKIISTKFTGIFIALSRFCIGIILIIPILILQRYSINKIKFKSLIIRGILGSISMILFFVAIQQIGSGRATLLLNLYPVFVLLFGFFFFSERITFITILVVILCLIGTFSIFSDHNLPSFIGAIIGILAAVLRGIGVHYIKKAGSENNVVTVYFSVCIFGLVLFPFSFTEVNKINNFETFFILILIGVLLFGSQVLLTYGLRFVSATSGSIIAYSSIPMTICLSFLVGEKLNIKYIIGIIFIIAGIFINILLKKRETLNDCN